ncbi:MAG: alpha-glucosidase/alpha-galactosidase [Promethearchaeota archaeon]
MKIVYLGAGSFRFSYGLFRNLCAAGEVIPLEVWLVDVDSPLLEVMRGFLTRQARKYHVPLSIHATPDRREALPGADVVYKSISIGQQDSEWYDVHVPQKFGIPQNTGDTVGPGGLFRALRVVPVVEEIVRDVEELCPDALLLNYTNPQAPIVLGAKNTAPRVQTVGLCHELFGGMRTVVKLLREALRREGTPELAKKLPHWEDLLPRYAGVNHFTWLLSFAGKDARVDLYDVLRRHASEGGKLAGRPFNFHLLERYGLFPLPGSRHVAEFLPEYYNYFNHLEAAKLWGMPKLRNVAMLRRARKLAIWGYRQVAKGRLRPPKPSVRGERAIEMTVDWLESKAGTRVASPREHVVNVLNEGGAVVPSLPDGCVVEVPSTFVDGRVVPTSPGPLPAEVRDLVAVHAKNTALFVDAATSGDPDKLLKAMLADPMCQFVEDDDAVEDMTWNLLHYEARWLPRFAESVPTRQDLEKLKHHVTPRDLAGRRAKAVKWPPRPELASKAYREPSAP